MVLHITNKRTKVTKTKDENFDKIEKGIREINHRITEYGKYVRIYLQSRNDVRQSTDVELKTKIFQENE